MFHKYLNNFMQITAYVDDSTIHAEFLFNDSTNKWDMINSECLIDNESLTKEDMIKAAYNQLEDELKLMTIDGDL